MLIDSGPGLAALLVGSLLTILLIGSVVVFCHRRFKRRQKSGEHDAVESAESTPSMGNEPVSPATIYYGETSLQPRQLTNDGYTSSLLDEDSQRRASRPIVGSAVAAAVEAATAAAAAAVASPAAAPVLSSVQHGRNSVAAVAFFKEDDLQTQSKSVRPRQSVANQPIALTTSLPKFKSAAGVADQVLPRQSLIPIITNEPQEELFIVSQTSHIRHGGRGESGSHGRTKDNSMDSSALSMEAEVSGDKVRRVSAWSSPIHTDSYSGMRRPLPLPPTVFFSHSEGPEGLSGPPYGMAAENCQGRRVSSPSERSAPVSERWRSNDSRYLPRTSWSGPSVRKKSGIFLPS